MNARAVYAAPDLGHPQQDEPLSYDFVLTAAERSQAALFRCALEESRRLANASATHQPTRLARANGCDQPDSARAAYPTTPAAREQLSLVEAPPPVEGGLHACASVHMSAGEAVE